MGGAGMGSGDCWVDSCCVRYISILFILTRNECSASSLTVTPVSPSQSFS